jgi:medium-chain acyl-[acyl-carrier-protein] hydrolase
MTPQAETSQWFHRLNPNPAAGIRLFCFPYAGGAAPAVFRAWPGHLSKTFEVCVPSLPGRGLRVREPAPTRLSFLVEQLAGSIAPLLDRPFAFYGHSLGALTAFELARSLRRAGLRAPEHLFVSGSRAPHMRVASLARHNLSDAELLEELGRLNGTPREVLENRELMELLLPSVRADFEMLESYSYAVEQPLACPVSAYGGAEDPEASRDDLEEWQRHTASRFSMRIFDGDHFFIHRHAPELLRVIAREVEDARAERTA